MLPVEVAESLLVTAISVPSGVAVAGKCERLDPGVSSTLSSRLDASHSVVSIGFGLVMRLGFARGGASGGSLVSGVEAPLSDFLVADGWVSVLLEPPTTYLGAKYCRRGVKGEEAGPGVVSFVALDESV